MINAAAKANIPQRNIFLFDDKKDKGIQPYSSLMLEEANPVEYLPEEVKSTTAYIRYNSNNTNGKSKFIETTHFDMVSNLSQMNACEVNINSDAIFISVWPFFHAYGLGIFTYFTLIKGSLAVLMPEFDPSAFCKVVQEQKVNVIIVTPPILSSLVDSKIAEKYNLSSLRLCISPAVSKKGLVEEFIKKFNVPVKQCHDLNEASPSTHLVKTVKASENSVLEYVGKLVSNVKYKVVSENEERLGCE